MATDQQAQNCRPETPSLAELPVILLDNRCGICDEKIDRDILAIALIGKQKHMAYLGRTLKFPFPIYGTYLYSPNGIAAYLDRRKTPVHLCFLCTRSTAWKACRVRHSAIARNHQYEAVATHHDCFSILIKSCPLPPRLACERLWKVAIAKYPWSLGYYELPSIPFTGSCHVLSTEAITKVASIYVLDQLANLPMELMALIRSYSPGTLLFWRAVTALTLASSLSNLPAIHEQRVGLGNIRDTPLYWKIGGSIRIPKAKVRPNDILRITLSPVGVRKIERLPRWPTCKKESPRQQKANKRFAWILCRVGCPATRNQTAYCQDGLLRFCFDNPGAPLKVVLPIWDTPMPPNLVKARDRGINFHWVIDKRYEIESFMKGHLINLDAISGLTFVYEGKKLVAVHSHRGDETNDFGVPVGSRNGLQQACFYLPVNGEDKIMAIGTQNTDAFVIIVEKSMSGDTVIGLPCPRFVFDTFAVNPGGLVEGDEEFFNTGTFLWGAREPDALLYGLQGNRTNVNLLGAYRYDPETWVPGRKSTDEPVPIPHRWPWPRLPSRDNQEDLSFHTYAPLEGVVSAQMFYSTGFVPDLEEHRCSGIIFHYQNGGSRVVGEVRLLNDRASIIGETILHPKLICLELPHQERPTVQRLHFLKETEIERGVHPVGENGVLNTSIYAGTCTRFPTAWAGIVWRMEGILDWWFTATERMRVAIRVEDKNLFETLPGILDGSIPA
ncbi:hypothetical protein B0T20DRAFT_496797 [Sordaria brevicollis]|uniref:Uncharacterized protein n=1 Tax=Sordaria brevicollis TaxID=83679 RepID=A0AAE0PIV6_SORBR|nr:hypothetical protein B0T20DRAFT_496797 [Sordaria brevicollis]